MNKEEMKRLLDVASGKTPADIVFKKATIVDVCNKELFVSDLYIKDGRIAGFGGKDFPKAVKSIDCEGNYIVPGLIDAHVHIESSHCAPSAFGDAVVPCGTTTIVADPHEICNVSGIAGLDYMLEATENIPLQAFFMVPSCVPATDQEHSGAIMDASCIATRISHKRVLGLGEMMNFPGVIHGDSGVLDKLMVARENAKVVDGHSPGIFQGDLDAYSASGILTDHECEKPEELTDRIRRGMYVMLRQGSACENVLPLLKGVTKGNMEYCLFCTDDKQPESILKEGHINYNVNLAITAGMDSVDAISMATINAAKCYHLHDRGAIAPGRRADFFITDTISQIHPKEVYIGGHLVAKDGKMITKSKAITPKGVKGKVNV
ncbi:MAG: amidohydrolase family protein, partial [Bacteroidales bacterium]|nr:amidohydrolase family protein [Bacteroidales bacterium]